MANHNEHFESEKNIDEWNVEGSLILEGKPCNPKINLNKMRGCTGPYENQIIEVYYANDIEKKSIVSKTITDSQGTFKLSLKPGDYVIYTKKNIMDIPNFFTIEKGKVPIKLELFVDTGIRLSDSEEN